MARNIETREGYEFWDRLNRIPKYGFLLAPNGDGVHRAEGIGNWIDRHEAQVVMDDAQSEVNELHEQNAKLEAEAQALRERLAFAEDAAAKGHDARAQCGGMEMEIQALREERDQLWKTFFNLAEKLGIDPEVEKSAPGKPSDVFLRHIEALRARVVVVPERKPVAASREFANRGWNLCLDELARLNGKVVSEGLLRRIAQDSAGYDQNHWEAVKELRALLGDVDSGVRREAGDGKTMGA